MINVLHQKFPTYLFGQIVSLLYGTLLEVTRVEKTLKSTELEASVIKVANMNLVKKKGVGNNLCGKENVIQKKYSSFYCKYYLDLI